MGRAPFRLLRRMKGRCLRELDPISQQGIQRVRSAAGQGCLRHRTGNSPVILLSPPDIPIEIVHVLSLSVKDLPRFAARDQALNVLQTMRVADLVSHLKRQAGAIGERDDPVNLLRRGLHRNLAQHMHGRLPASSAWTTCSPCT